MSQFTFKPIDPRGDLVGTISHALQTPLTAIKGFIELVAEGDAGPVTDTQREFLQIAACNSEKLGILIHDVLEVNLLHSSRFDARREPLELASILADVVTRFRVIAQSKGLTFREDVRNLPQILGDGARLVQVFSNLMSNAIMYTPQGEVGIQARPCVGGVEVIIHDTGIGLEPEEQAQLFTRLFRGRNPLVVEAGGSGLGLVIAKAIVERHAGTIELVSRPGEGTRCRVMLPMSRPDASGSADLT